MAVGGLRARAMALSSRGASSTFSHAQHDDISGESTITTTRPRNRRAAPSATSTSSQSLLDVPTARSNASSRTGSIRGGKGVATELRSGDVLGSHSFTRARSAGPAAGYLDGGWGAGWSRLSGLASSVLTGDYHRGRGADGYDSDNGSRHFTKSGGSQKGGFWPTSGAWGVPEQPTKDPLIGVGSTAEREAAVRAKKMARVLENRDASDGRPDVNGNVKRRTSVDDSNPGLDADEEALVYIHPVRPQDTMAGVVLRYNCQAAVFKKANGFWPHDSIQIRKFVLLPVDACSIRGTPCDPPTTTKPASSQTMLDNTDPFSLETPTLTKPECAETDEDSQWTHVRWVRFDSSPDSAVVEVGRMPRKTLGYFPPRRRKSQSTLSAVSTPRPSLDWSQNLSRSFSTNSPQASQSPRLSLSGSAPTHSRNGSYFSPRPGMARRESVTEAADRLGWMKGPGGVGTLGKNVKRPGPAKDALNAWANKHVPGIAIDSLPSTSISDAERVSFGFKDDLQRIAEGRYEGRVSGTVTPNSSNQGMGLEHAAAAVEGWFRRLAANAPSTPKMTARWRPEPGDLIEMLDGPGSDDGRVSISPRQPATMPSSSMGSTGRSDANGSLRERDLSMAKNGKRE